MRNQNYNKKFIIYSQIMKEHNYSYLNGNIEINIKPKQHFELSLYPLGISIPEDSPILVIKLFIISFFIRFSFIKTKPLENNIIHFGISFNDYDKYVHVFPDYLGLYFYKSYKLIDLPWKQIEASNYYETKVSKQLHLKDGLKNKHTKDNLKYSQHILIDDYNILVFYYKYHKIFKYHLFNKFFNYDSTHIQYLIIEYEHPTKGNISETIEIIENIDINEKLNEWCKENNYIIIE